MTSAGPAESGAFDPVEFLETAVSHASHTDVTDMREYLTATLSAAGIESTVDEAGNVLATRQSPAPDDGPHVVLNTHIDTVSPHVTLQRDRSATVAGDSGVDIIRGRGACDAKGPLAALLAGFLTTDPVVGRVTLAITPDEERYSTGAHALVSGQSSAGPLDADLYVVGEPTDLDICTAARGRFQGQVTLSGETAHAAESAGINAIAAAEDTLAAIRTFDADRETHSLLGRPRLTPTVVEGGQATNQVPDTCVITIDRRSVPPETADGFRSALETAVRETLASDAEVEVSLTSRETPFLEAFATDPETALVERVAAEVSDATDGYGGDRRSFGAATEASYFAPTPTIVFGPGQLADAEAAVAHSDREYVRVNQLRLAGAATTRALDALLSGRD